MTPAQKIQAHIRKICLINKDVIQYQNKIVSCARRGFPDIVAVINSNTYYFEVKAENDTESDLQEHTRNLLNYKKKVCYICESCDEFNEQIKEVARNESIILKFC